MHSKGWHLHVCFPGGDSCLRAIFSIYCGDCQWRLLCFYQQQYWLCSWIISINSVYSSWIVMILYGSLKKNTKHCLYSYYCTTSQFSADCVCMLWRSHRCEESMISFLRISNNISCLEASCYINNINICSEINVCTYLQPEDLPISELLYFWSILYYKYWQRSIM